MNSSDISVFEVGLEKPSSTEELISELSFKVGGRIICGSKSLSGQI